MNVSVLSRPDEGRPHGLHATGNGCPNRLVGNNHPRGSQHLYRFIANGDPLGNSSNVNTQRRLIRWPDGVTPASALTFRVNIPLEPGRSQISIGVTDEHSHEKGLIG
jgi:hypothetical protein